MRLLQRDRSDRDAVGNLVVLAFIGKWGALPRLEQDLDDLRKSRAALCGFDVVAAEFIEAIAAADSEFEPAAAQEVDFGHLLGETHRMIERSDDNSRADSDAAGDSGDISGEGEDGAVGTMGAEVMFGKPGAGQSQLVGAGGPLQPFSRDTLPTAASIH